MGLTRDTVLEMMKDSSNVADKNHILVDLHWTDFEGGFIRGAVNLPAQSLHATLPTLYTMFREAGLLKVIWYCSSSRGRGTRAANWFHDYLAKCGDDQMESLISLEGIKGWATAGDEFVSWMEEYDPSFWAPKPGST
ncbi:Rhodanese-like domain-containing protein [Xylaria digitata]|nr:Rhodanese-like domain-containing protein [Xylaria digitata]